MVAGRPRILRASAAAAVVCMLLMLHGALVAGQPAASRLALVGGMLLDGYDAPPIHHAAVLIEGNRIVDVGPAAELEIPPDYVVVDTTGRTMMPGLIELHAHLLILGHGDYGRWFSWIEENGGDAMLSRIMAISAKQLLMAGVTSAVDLGAPVEASLDIRDRIERGETPGPRMSMSGPWITRSGGRMTNQFGGITITSSAEAARETEKLIDAGVGRDQGPFRLDTRRLQVDCACRSRSERAGTRACVWRAGRQKRARSRRGCPDPCRLRRYGPALQHGLLSPTS